MHAQAEEDAGNVVFLGRLANYKYFNMDQAVKNALDVFDSKIKPQLETARVLAEE